MRLHSVIAGGANASDQVHLKTDLVMTLASEIERLGLATADEFESLAERVVQEMTKSQSVIIGRAEIGAWSQV